MKSYLLCIFEFKSVTYEIFGIKVSGWLYMGFFWSKQIERMFYHTKNLFFCFWFKYVWRKLLIAFGQQYDSFDGTVIWIDNNGNASKILQSHTQFHFKRVTEISVKLVRLEINYIVTIMIYLSSSINLKNPAKSQICEVYTCN